MSAGLRHHIQDTGSGSTVSVAASGLTVQANDIVILTVKGYTSLSAPSSTDITWTEIESGSATSPYGASGVAKMWVGVASGALADFTVTMGVSDQHDWTLTSISGGDTGTPIDVSDVAVFNDNGAPSGDEDDIDCPSVSPTGSDSFLIAIGYAFMRDDPGTGTLTVPSGMTALGDTFGDFDYGRGAYLALSASGATGVKTFVHTTGFSRCAWIGFTVAVKSASGATPVSLAGTMPAFTGGLQIKQPQAVAGSFPEQVGVITRQLSLARAVAGSVPEQVGTLQIKQPQLVEGALPAPTGDVVALSAKTVAGSLAAPTGDVVALYAKRNLSGVMPEFVGVVSPRQSLFRALTGTFPEMTGDVSAFAAAVQLAGIFPEMTGTLARQLSLFRALTATMPVFTGTVTPVVIGGVNVAGSMPAQSGALTLFWDEGGSEGPNNGATFQNVALLTREDWVNPGNVLSSDGTYATVSLTSQGSDYLTVSRFGFNIPTGATILGIEATVEIKTASGNVGMRLEVAKSVGGTWRFPDNANQTATTTEQVLTFGGPTDLPAGTTWSPSDINSIGFCVGLRTAFDFLTDTVSVDHIQVKVYYSVRAGKLVGAFGPQTGDVTTIETIALAGTMPEQTGALSLLGRIAVGGTMPEMVGAVDVRQFAALTGLMPEQSGVLSLLAHIALSGSMPEQVGLILSDLGVFVAGSMPEQSGALSLLAHIALSGSMPESTGALAIIAAKILAGEMPEFTGDLTIDRLLSHIALTGEMGDFLGTLVVPTSPGWMRPKGGGSLYIPRPKGGGSLYQPRPKGGFGFHQPRP